MTCSHGLNAFRHAALPPMPSTGVATGTATARLSANVRHPLLCIGNDRADAAADAADRVNASVGAQVFMH